ncbi:MAG TPA: hypothetical protein VEK07_12250 [Polyangiaceae bacterium]|nr:hypothetical protein [Polyangiaceae bacterium]
MTKLVPASPVGEALLAPQPSTARDATGAAVAPIATTKRHERHRLGLDGAKVGDDWERADVRERRSKFLWWSGARRAAQQFARRL